MFAYLSTLEELELSSLQYISYFRKQHSILKIYRNIYEIFMTFNSDMWCAKNLCGIS